VALEVFDARTDIRNLFITPEIRSRIMRFEPGQVSEGHTHDVGHEMFVVLAGQAEFTIGGESAVLGPLQMCVARAGEWHALRTVGDEPMTLYLSVTPHLEPTHTQWDRAGGTRLPYRYGVATQDRSSASPETLVARHLAASEALASAAQGNLAAQQTSASTLTQAIETGATAAAHEALDQMTNALQSFYVRFREAELAWNELAAAVGN